MVAFGDGTIALVVEMLTTTPTSFPASWEKMSANWPGVCGAVCWAGGMIGWLVGCAQTGTAHASDSVNAAREGIDFRKTGDPVQRCRAGLSGAVDMKWHSERQDGIEN